MQEPIQERGGRCRGLGRSPGNGSGDGSLLGGSRHDLTPTHEGIVPSTDRAGWGRSISVQRGNKVILSVAAIGNQTRWSESSPTPASFQRILVSDSLCREGTRPNASFSWKAEIVGPGKLTLACCEVAVDACFLSYRICCAGSGKVSRPRRSADGRFPGDAPTVGNWKTHGRRGRAGHKTTARNSFHKPAVHLY